MATLRAATPKKCIASVGAGFVGGRIQMISKCCKILGILCF